MHSTWSFPIRNIILVSQCCTFLLCTVLFVTPLGSEIKLQNIKTEPSSMFFGPPSNDSKQGLVSVAITLRPAAAEVKILPFTDFH